MRRTCKALAQSLIDFALTRFSKIKRSGATYLVRQPYHWRRLACEPLEQRAMLAIDAAIYAAVQPEWFAAIPRSMVATETLGDTSAQDQASEWIVRLKNDALDTTFSVAQASSVLAMPSLGLQVVRGLGLPGQLLVRATASAEQVSTYLNSTGIIEYCYPNYQLSASATPNDPSYDDLWGMNNVGQSSGTVDDDIDAPEAWDISTGTSSIVVGVIDTGIDYTHPDLVANIWTNPGEIAGNSIDDDGNGFVDDVHGYDFFNNDGDPMDDNSHGTHVAGTIGAVGHNNVGVVGVNWTTSMMALKFLGSGNSGPTSGGIAAINYATMMRRLYDVNIRVTNNSWGGGGFNQGLLDAINAGGAAGILFVAAAGNGGADGVGDNNNVTPEYPASLNSPYIISVAATDRNDALGSFSNFGATTVDLAAPGVAILSTTPGNTYQVISGTSMATPHVTGVAALALSVDPNLNVVQLKTAILNGVDAKANLAGKMVTGGRLNALNTLNLLPQIAALAVPFTEPMTATSPLGSEIYIGTTSANILSPGDLDRFSLELHAGQTLSLSLVPSDVEIRPQLELTGPGTNVSFTAPAAGVRAVWQTILISNAGTYTITASGADGTIGNYQIRAYLNAAVETESLGGTDNSSRANAQNINGSFISLGANSSRGAVVGQTTSVVQAVPTFIDISTSGTKSTTAVTDDASDSLGPAQLNGFSFAFYGVTYDTLHFNTNGLISFTGTDSAFFNTNLSTSPSQPAIAVLWDDLLIENSGTGTASRNIYWQVIGAGSSQQLVIQWNNARRAAGGSFFSFQAVLSRDGTIQLNYGPTVPTAVISSATVGAKAAGTSNPQRTLISFNQQPGPLVGPGRSTRFSTSNDDYYSFALSTGEAVTLAATNTTTLELQNAAGTVLATGTIAASNLTMATSTFVALTNGTYYARVRGPSEYRLVVTRNAVFDLEPNSSLPTAQTLGPNNQALGHIGDEATSAYAYDDGTSENGVGLVGDVMWLNAFTADFGSNTINSISTAFGNGLPDGTTFQVLLYDDPNDDGNPIDAVLLNSATSVSAGAGTSQFVNVPIPSTTVTGVYFAAVSVRNVASGQFPAPLDTSTTARQSWFAGHTVANSFNITTLSSNNFSPRLVESIGLFGNFMVRANTTALNDDEDWYQFQVVPGDRIRVQTFTPGDAAGDFVNTLDPSIGLYLPGGGIIDTNDNGAPDGRNALLEHVATQSGLYKVRLGRSAGSAGEYLLQVDVQTTTVTFALTGSPLIESGGTATMTATLSGTSSQTVTVDFSFAGTAALGVDYSASSTSIAIPAGQTSGSITLTALNDFTDEANETIVVDITAVTNGTESGTQQVTATISDDDPTPSVTLSLAGSPMAENGGTAVVVATLSNPSSQNITIDLSYTGTATNLSDYTRSATQIVILAGNTSGSITLTSLNDITDEPNETIVVDVTGVTNGVENGSQQVVATINDDDPTPSVALSLAGSPISENGGVASVVATLSNPSSQAITIDLGFTGIATNAVDYNRSATQIVIAAGSTSGSISVTSLNDITDEPNETITVDITNVTNGTENGSQQVIATINDDDATPSATLQLTGSPLAENGGVALVTATLSNPSSQDITIDLGFTGTAVNTADYNRSGTQIVITAGNTSGSITINGVDDITDELNETVVVDIVGVTGGIENGAQQVTATINDDDPTPLVTLTLAGSPLAENGGVAVVTATLSNLSSQDVTITLGFTGTATNATDYSRSGTQIVITAGNTSGSITLASIDDITDETNETIVVDVTNVTNGNENGSQQVIATINDDDPVPAVTLLLSGSPLAENGGIATVTATLSNPSSQNITIDLSYTGTATNLSDYNHSGNQIVILAGSTSGSIVLTSLQDITDEVNETIIVDVANVTNGVENGSQQVTATINDDDPVPTVTLVLSGSPMAEAGGVAIVRATLSNPSSQAIIVDLDFAGTATNLGDYSRSGAQIVIAAGSTSGSISVTSLNDITDEPNETITVDITNVTNGTENGSQQVIATINDDDATPSATLQLTGSPLAENGGVALVTATLSNPSSQDITIDLGFTGTAVNTADYNRSGTQIVITAGNTSGSITINGVDDITDELNETVVVDIVGVTGGIENGAQQVTATINDDDPTPLVTLTLAGSPLAENGGVAVVAATLSNPSSQDVTITLGFTGTATNAADYSRSGTQIVITAGNTSGSITLAALNDITDEAVETIIVDVSSVANGIESGSQQVTATVNDDDPTPSVTLVLAGSPMNENAGIAAVVATLSNPSSQDVTVALDFAGTATHLADYTRSGVQIIIAAGSISNSVNLASLNDITDEPDETIVVDIASVTNGLENGSQQVTATINDDDSTPNVTLQLNGSPLAENGGIATIVATLSNPSSQNITIDLGFTGLATNLSDYSRSGTQIVILAGNTSGSITVTGIDDITDELNETIVVDITSVTNGIENGSQQVAATISDDDPSPSVTLQLSGSPLAENAGAGTITATLSNPSSQDVTITLGFTGTATNVADYSRSGAQIVITAGSTSGSITLTAVDDTTDEANETVIVDVTGVTNGVEIGTQQVTATINDDDPAPNVTLSMSGSPLNENGGIATITAALSNPSSQDVTIDLGFTGTATNSSDYSRSATQIVIPAGSTSGSISLTSLNDITDEPNETVVVDVVNVTNGTENGSQQVVATINDDDPTPNVTLLLLGSPLAENGGVASVTATLSNPSSQNVTIDLGFTGTAVNLGDYNRSATQIIIAAGSTSGSITLTALNDNTDEASETIIVDVTGVTSGIENGTQQIVATISDDDPTPSVTLLLAGSPLAENSGVAIVTATLSNPSSQDITIDLGFGGTATNLSDYSRSATQIVVLAGNTSGSITMTGIEDITDELNETIVVDITSVTNGTENGTQQVTATINDNDLTPSVTLGSAGSALAENGGAATVTATLSNPSSQDVTINLGFSGTAANAADYSRSATQIVIAAGNTSGSITLVSLDDNTDEAIETIVVDITSVSNGVENGSQQIIATINDDDPTPVVTLSLSGSPLNENGGIATVFASLSNPSSQDITITLGFAGAATNLSDYSRSGTQIVIAAGNTSGSITITALDDNIDEANETVVVDVTGVTNGVENGAQQVTATVNDDDLTPSVALSLAGSPLNENGGVATVTATISNPSSQDITIDLGFSGTASNLSDYSRSATQITIAAGNTSGSITLTAVNDFTDEANETIIVDIASVTNGVESGTQQGTVTINDDDPTPSVTLALVGSPMTENTGAASVIATLTNPSSQVITIDLGFSGTAINAVDYSRSGAQIVIAAGNTSGSITLASLNDNTDESNETIVVDVIGVTNSTENGTQQVTATITDDDPAPSVTLLPVGNPFAENGGVATVIATLSNLSTQAVTIDLAFSGTATNLSDYSRSAVQIVVAAGNSSGSITLTGLNDVTQDPNETVIVEIAGVINGFENGTQQTTATIDDDDGPPNVVLSVIGNPFSENGGAALVTATLSNPTFQNVTINLGFVGTASNLVDYSRSSAQIVVVAGQTSGSINLTGLNDITFEGDETVIVDVTDVTNGNESGTQQVVVTIADDESAPSVTLTVSGGPLAENGGVANVLATLSNPSTQVVTIDLGFTGTATNSSDYSRSNTQIVIAAGSTSGSITFAAVNDITDETNETIVVDVAGVTNGVENGSQQVTVTINDDDLAPSVTLSLAGSPLNETGGVATITATLSNPSSQDVTIDLGFIGTATNLSDYSRSASQIVVIAGSTNGSITLTSLNDLTDEANETIVVDVTSITNGSENGTQQVTATINDDDLAPTATLTLAGSPLNEVGGVSTVAAMLSNPSSQDITVTLGFSGTAANLADYSRSAAQIVIAAGNMSGSITLVALNDNTDEVNETIVVDITSVTNGTENGTQQVTATILDDDPTPNVTLALVGSPLNENGGSAAVSATLSNPSSQDITITLGFTGTATNLSDYSRSATQIVILAGNTSGSIMLSAVDDVTFEGAESIMVDVTGVSNGTENGTQQVIATIADNDAAPTVSLSLVGNPFSETGGVASVVASLSNPSTLDVTVQLGFTGAALPSVDYSASGASVVIPAGSTSGVITLAGLDDATFEGNEAIIVDVTGVTGGAENGSQQVIATINEDDSPPSVSLTLSGSPFAENGGVATVTATLSNPSTQNVTINLGFTGTATSNGDYSRSSAQIVILAGATSGAISLFGIDDLTDEADESVIVDITSVVNGTENGSQQVTALVGDDDGAPSVVLNVTGSPLSENNGNATVTATLSNLTAQNVTINLNFTGTAVSGVDYSVSATSIVILAGQTSGAVTLTGLNDNIDELNEAIVVDVVDVTNGVESGTQQVTATISDDDLAPSVAITLAGSPLAENGGVATVTATLSHPSSQNVTVQLGFAGDALGGVDYSTSTTAIVISAGQTSGVMALIGLNDNIDELNEAIVVDVVDVTNGVESGTQQVIATINDDEPTPSVQWTLAGTTVAENAGSVSLVVTLSGPSSQPITVPFAVSGTATSGSDYALSASPIAIPAGATSASITLTTIDDATSEGTETVVVTLDPPTNATLGAITSRTTQITDNDAPPTVSLTASSFTLAENGGSITLFALLSTVLGQDVTVDLSFAGSASQSIDYSASAASIVIAAGQTSGSITIASRNDALAEGNETLVVNVSNVAGAVENGTQQTVITLVDDSSDPFAITGSQLTIVGSSNNDSLILQFITATTISVQLNDTSTTFALAQIDTIDFDGQGGDDTLLYFGSVSADTATLSTSGATVSGMNHTFSANNVKYKYLFGDANDSATFSDTDGADQLYQLPAYSLMLDGSLSYYNQVIGFGSVTANTTTGIDILLVYGTGGNDTYSGSTTSSTMNGTNVSLIGNGFDQVYAFGSGGNDIATFNGSSGSDVFYGLGGYGFSVVTSGAFLQYMIGFSEETANGSGGDDSAIFFDAAGNDTFTGSPNSASMTGPLFTDTANGFDSVYVIASGGGNDTANLDGSNADDLFSGNAFDAALFRSGVYLIQVYAFEQVNVNLTGAGIDVAELIDGFGDDVLNASGSTAEITYAAGNKIKLDAFDFVFAKSQNGGTNTKQVIDPLAYQLVFEGIWD